jgi:NAD(P)H-dependent flavin oxidoreductase YrpB (nitropropane dioxygenase family)
VKIVLHRQETQNMDFIFERKWHNVVHVVSSSVFALKAQDAGVDAIVAEGFEAS